jgi:error-prone DNA polymerase
MEVEGEIQRSKEGVMHVIARRVFDRSSLLNQLTDDRKFQPPMSHADGPKNPTYERHGHPRNVRVLPKSRDFH